MRRLCVLLTLDPPALPCSSPARPLAIARPEIGRAYATLSDADKKQDYDRFGTEEPEQQRYQRAHRGEEIDPADIFNMFFGGGMQGGMGGGGMHFRHNMGGNGWQHAGGNRAQRRGNQQQGEGPPAGGLGQILQLMPLILLFMMSFMSFPSMSGDESYFALHRKEPFTIKRTTRNHHVDFFVKSDFAMQYTGRGKRHVLQQVETMVEQQYYQHLTERCQKDKYQRVRVTYVWVTYVGVGASVQFCPSASMFCVASSWCSVFHARRHAHIDMLCYATQLCMCIQRIRMRCIIYGTYTTSYRAV